MDNWVPDARTEKHLKMVHPVLADKIRIVLSEMHKLGHPMTITDGNRTTAEQQALYAKGRTIPPIGRKYRVTNADGVKNKSNHQGGRAVDCTFLNAKGQPHWPEKGPWETYGNLVKAVGLKWGGDFNSINDRPHAELLL